MLPPLEKLSVSKEMEVTVERRVWVDGRVVNVQLALQVPGSGETAKVFFEALRPVMAMSVSRESLKLQSQFRHTDENLTAIVFGYTWEGSDTMAVWEISDRIGLAMDVRRLMNAAFAQHSRYKVVSVKGIDPDAEDLSKIETRRHVVTMRRR